MFSYFTGRVSWNRIWCIRDQAEEPSRTMPTDKGTKGKDNNTDDVEYISQIDCKQPSELIISLAEGEQLPAMDINGNSDCYAVITVGNKSYKSDIVTSLNPVWNTVFKFNYNDIKYSNYIIIDIFDYDTVTSDDDIGTIMIHLSDCGRYSDYQWISLQRKSNQLTTKQLSGKIKVKLQLNNMTINHNKIYNNTYQNVILPLTRSLSLNPMLLLKPSTTNQAVAVTNSSPKMAKLKKYIGFNAIPNINDDDNKDESLSISDDDKLDIPDPQFVSGNSTHLYHNKYSKDDFIEYPVKCEYIEVFLENVIFLFNKFNKVVPGDIYLTNFRILLRFTPNELSQEIYFGSILELKLLNTEIAALPWPGIMCNVLIIKVNDGRLIKVIIPFYSKHKDKYNIFINELYIKLNIILLNIDNNIHHNGTHLIHNRCHTIDAWNIFNINNEFIRQKLNPNVWNSSDNYNLDYSICSTYPSIFYIPSLIDNKDTLINASSFRSKQRLPVLIWYNNRKNNSLLRCSQPSGNDDEYIELIRKSVSVCDGVNVNDVNVVIYDCRSLIAAEANKLKGKGFENIDRYTHHDNISINFLEIGNIHCMRKSYNLLINIVYDRYLCNEYNENEWFKNIKLTLWNDYIKLLIKNSLKIGFKLLNDTNTVCIIHCSDGWDRTSQISALTQLSIDPYYRTIAGFLILIEKEWLSFGHKFNERNGFNINKKDQRSPIFIQFLECIWQIIQMHSSEFEFTSDLILRLCVHHNSNWFGNFIYNNEKERNCNNINYNTISLWSWPVIKNKKYNPTKFKLLDININKLQPIFSDFLLKYDDMFAKIANDINNNDNNNDNIDIKQTKPKWVQDKGTRNCFSCKSEFHFFRRRHHCRSCGQIFCDKCSTNRIKLKHFGYNDLVRVCVDCFKLNKL